MTRTIIVIINSLGNIGRTGLLEEEACNLTSRRAILTLGKSDCGLLTYIHENRVNKAVYYTFVYLHMHTWLGFTPTSLCTNADTDRHCCSTAPRLIFIVGGSSNDATEAIALSPTICTRRMEDEGKE